jgi:oxygen-independent coproporphyrinogen-3 oxidase
MTIREKFESRKNDNKYNTSYPLSPEDWKEYEVSGELKFDTSKPISFYIHIPFCNSLCKFCEYTRTKTPDSSVINQYLLTLENDIDRFISKNGYIKIKP